MAVRGARWPCQAIDHQRMSHKQALIALTRRRSDVLFAVLRDGSLYNPGHALAA